MLLIPLVSLFWIGETLSYLVEEYKQDDWPNSKTKLQFTHAWHNLNIFVIRLTLPPLILFCISLFLRAPWMSSSMKCLGQFLKLFAIIHKVQIIIFKGQD